MNEPNENTLAPTNAVGASNVTADIVGRALGWLTTSGVGAQIAQWIGIMLAPIIVPLIEKAVSNVFDRQTIVSKPIDDLQHEFDS